MVDGSFLRHTLERLPRTDGFALVFLTVIDLPVRADVSRADMVLACLGTRVGMSPLGLVS